MGCVCSRMEEGKECGWGDGLYIPGRGERGHYMQDVNTDLGGCTR